MAVEEVSDDHIHQYGVVAGEPLKDGVYRITDMVEKPSKEEAPSNLGIIGRYILTPDIFDMLRDTAPGKNGELQITDALENKLKKVVFLHTDLKVAGSIVVRSMDSLMPPIIVTKNFTTMDFKHL